MSKVNFIFILSFIFFNFSFNNVFASSEFSNDFIEQAKKLGITIDKKSTHNKTSNNKNIKILDNKNFSSTNVQSLPEVPKPQDSKQVKLPEVPKNKINKKEKLQQNKNTIKSNKKLNQKAHLKNSKNNITKNDKVNLVKKKVVHKKNKKSISYFPAPEEFIDNNDFNEKNYMRRKPYNYDIKPPKYLLDLQKKGIKTNIPKFMFKDELSKLLFVAVNDQNIGAIKGLLLKGANINAQNKSNEYTPLMYAVENGKTNSLRYLLIRGANPNLITSNKMFALHLAAIMNNLKTVRVLLRSDVNMFLQDKYNKTFFDYVQEEHKNIVISDIFDIRKDADKALIDFCTLRSLEGMKFAIKNNANVNAQNNNGDTPLILAVRYNNPKLVIYLLSIGADHQLRINIKVMQRRLLYKINTVKF
jgi:ankyrin repeat protein